MKVIIVGNTCTVTRENSDPKFYGITGESKLLHHIKLELNKAGYNLIKKRMWKDGHLVDDYQQYLRTKKGHGICIYSPFFALRGANEDFNGGKVVLTVTAW